MTAYAQYEESGRVWRLGNEAVEQTLRAVVGEPFEVTALRDKRLPTYWTTQEGSFAPWEAVLDGEKIESARARVEFVEAQERPAGVELAVGLMFEGRGTRLRCALLADHHLPVFRVQMEIENTDGTPHTLNAFSLLRLALPASMESLRTFHVENFAGHRMDKWDPEDNNFRLHERTLSRSHSESLELDTGAYRRECSWLALRTESEAGLVIGLEYDGAARLAVEGGAQGWLVSATPAPYPLDLLLSPGERVPLGGAFYGLFQGDWDAASHVTHQLVEERLALPAPDANFPYVIFNSWGYQTDIDQEKIERAVELAADLGAEVFDVDYGWSRGIGDWHPNAKFPDMAGLGQKIRAAGMKFGLWMAFSNALPDAPILQQHPDWTCAPNDWGSFKTRALCLAHAPVQEWIVSEVRRVVSAFGIDLLKHDFELITPCNRPGHAHPPTESDFHSVRGYHEILSRLQEVFPNLILENCQGGGRMMTFEMVKQHHTSITGDGAVLQDGMLRRQAVYGATYPFPPRFCNNYMEEAPTAYACRSSMVGGPWILMHKFAEWSPAERGTCREHIALYKQLRRLAQEGVTYHLAPPNGQEWDAIQAHHPGEERGFAFVFRPDASPLTQYTLFLRGLSPTQSYRVRTYDGGQEWRQTGQTLMQEGLPLTLQEPRSSEILLIESQPFAGQVRAGRSNTIEYPASTLQFANG